MAAPLETEIQSFHSSTIENILPHIIHGIFYPVTVMIPDEKGIAEIDEKSHQLYESIRKGGVILGTDAVPSEHKGLPISPRKVNGHVEFDREGGNYSD